MSSYQTNPTCHEQNADHNHRQAPRNTPESLADAQTRRQIQTHTGVIHPSPSKVNVSLSVQTAKRHTGNIGTQNQATVNNGQTHTPAYAWQNVQGHPYANVYTRTHYCGQTSQITWVCLFARQVLLSMEIVVRVMVWVTVNNFPSRLQRHSKIAYTSASISLSLLV